MRRVAAWIVAIAFIFVGVLFISNGMHSYISDKREIEDVAWISSGEIEKDTPYLVRELTVVSDYARLDADSVVYLVVTFDDMNGKTVAASMSINKSSDIWRRVDKYLRDDAMGPGDLVLSCYVKTEPFVNVQGELEDMFATGLRNASRSMGVTLKRLNYSLCYLCSSKEDPTELINTTSMVGIVAGGIAVVLAVLIIVFVGLRKSKPKAKRVASVQQSVPAGHYRPSVQYQHPAQQAPQSPYQRPVPPQPPAAHAQYQRPVPSPVSGQKPASAQQTKQPAPAQRPIPAQQPVPTPQAAFPQQSVGEIREYLDRLKQLQELGYVTQEEYDQKRKELLGL